MDVEPTNVSMPMDQDVEMEEPSDEPSLKSRRLCALPTESERHENVDTELMRDLVRFDMFEQVPGEYEDDKYFLQCKKVSL